MIVKKIIILTSFFAVLFSASVQAAMPIYERLDPIEFNLNAPTSVAVDQSGCIYVAESVSDKVHLYTQSGAYIETLSGLSMPISVAVDGSGKIYVGNKGSGNVEVYNNGLTFQYKLGAGDGEFMQPGAIAIDSAGKIYVADSGADKIKIYSTDGSYEGEFGISGSGDGKLHFPTSIAIDEASDELIISDLQLITDSYGDEIEGARIHVYEKSGTNQYKRSFGDSGVGTGKISKPMGVELDSAGRVYVTDSVQHVVHIYENDGTYLGTLYDLIDPMRNPLGIAFSGGNRLHMASMTTGTVEIYGIETYTDMVVSPLSLSYEGQAGSSLADQEIQITNNGTGDLDWSTSISSVWTTLSESTGTTSAGAVTSLDVTVDPAGLPAGTYNGSITVASGTGETEIIAVELIVQPTPELSVDVTELEYTSVNGSLPGAQSASITNIGEGTMNWSAAKDSGWITLSKASGTAPDSVDVSVDITSKVLGSYTGTITVTGEGAQSSPASIAVTMNITQQTGTINVTANIPEAGYTINGPESFTGSGTSWTRAGALTGTYSIIYADAEDYETPSAQSGALTSGGALNFTGVYTAAEPEVPALDKNIITGAGPGKRNTGLVKIYKSDGTYTGVSFLAHGYSYGVNVAAGDINCDGVEEIITAPGPGPNNPAEISVYDKDGNKLTNLTITASANKYGATVASGDLDGDGDDELIVGAGAGAGNASDVKVYEYDEAGGELIESGIDLQAYAGGYGVKVSAADVDNDGIEELITAPGPGPGNSGEIKIWTVDTSLGAGQWSASIMQSYTVDAPYGYSVSIAGGDLDGDGNAEVITGYGPHRRARDVIMTYDINGDKVEQFKAYMARSYGVMVAAGDLNNDGTAEIIAGAGPGRRNRAIVKVFDANGIELRRFRALRTRYGVNVAVGDLGIE